MDNRELNLIVGEVIKRLKGMGSKPGSPFEPVYKQISETDVRGKVQSLEARLKNSENKITALEQRPFVSSIAPDEKERITNIYFNPETLEIEADTVAKGRP